MSGGGGCGGVRAFAEGGRVKAVLPIEPVTPPQILESLRGRAMARNTVWQVAGQVAPLFIAAFAIPILIRRMGVERFGVLTLAWGLIGYFSLYDLGLGRALTKVVSELVASGRTRELARMIWTALLLMFLLGAVFAVPTCFAANWISYRLLKVPPDLLRETSRSVFLLTVIIPIITASTGLRGILEGEHRFREVSTVRIFTGAYNFLGPLAATWFSNGLVGVIAVLVAGRVATALVYFIMCLRSTPGLRSEVAVELGAARILISTGSWITVSNLIGPVMTYLDRFLITGFLTVAAVAYYTTPFEMVTKLWLVPTAVSTVAFPAFAALGVIDTPKLIATYARTVRFCFLLLYPAVFLIVLFAPEGLHLWLGPVFAANSSVVARWLAIGILINSLAMMPYALLQAVNRPDIPGKLHLVEMPLYVGAAVVAIKMYGLPGAAVVWSARLMAEGLVLFYCARKTLVPGALRFRFVLGVLMAMGILFAVQLESGWPVKVATAVVVLGIFVVLSWRWLLDDQERHHLRSAVGSAFTPVA